MWRGKTGHRDQLCSLLTRLLVPLFHIRTTYLQTGPRAYRRVPSFANLPSKRPCLHPDSLRHSGVTSVFAADVWQRTQCDLTVGRDDGSDGAAFRETDCLHVVCHVFYDNSSHTLRFKQKCDVLM